MSEYYVLLCNVILCYIGGQVDIIITEWALDSYLELVHAKTFSKEEYKETIRPDVERLKVYPNDLKFQVSTFWGRATDLRGQTIQDGYKMKWRQIGNGKVQLRLAIAILGEESFLCRGYVKSDEKVDRREMAKFKNHIRDIHVGNYEYRGLL